MKKKKIVVIGGGSGTATVLTGLLYYYQQLVIQAVVSMADSGGSSGEIRDKDGVLPPGDVLKAIVALSPVPFARFFLLNRFHGLRTEQLNGHTVGNFLLTRMAQWADNDYIGAIRALEQMFECKGTVWPVTLDNVHLVAETNHRIITGEGEIEKWIYDEKTIGTDEKILAVKLEPKAEALPEVLTAIREANIVVIGPGSFYTSLSPSVQAGGIQEALAEARQVVYVTNVTSHPKETGGWTVSEFVNKMEAQIQRRVDVVISNKGLSPALRKKYASEHSFPVEVDVPADWNGRKVIVANFIGRGSTFARHNPRLLAKTIIQL